MQKEYRVLLAYGVSCCSLLRIRTQARNRKSKRKTAAMTRVINNEDFPWAHALDFQEVTRLRSGLASQPPLRALHMF